jgi:AcrR family transcriptional regulator
MVQIANKTKSYYTICSKASDLFHKHGIRKVSIEELCDQAGVSKMTFYRIFKNKEELVHHIIVEDFNKNLEKQQELLESDLPLSEKIKGSMNLKKETSKQYSKEFIFDLLNSKDQQIVEKMQDFGDKGRLMFRSFLEQNQKEGNIRKSLNLDFLMLYLAQLQTNIPNETALSMFDSVEAYSEEFTSLVFYGIFSEE